MNDDFDRDHLKNFSAARENKRLDDANGLNPDDDSKSSSRHTRFVALSRMRRS
ncbi:hypothetical protein B0H19DRAFT_1098512, partial [Mycena capillaripes]